MKQDPPLLIGVWSNDPGNDITAIFILFLVFFFFNFSIFSIFSIFSKKIFFFFFQAVQVELKASMIMIVPSLGFTPDVSQWFLASSIS